MVDWGDSTNYMSKKRNTRAHFSGLRKPRTARLGEAELVGIRTSYTAQQRSHLMTSMVITMEYGDELHKYPAEAVTGISLIISEACGKLGGYSQSRTLRLWISRDCVTFPSQTMVQVVSAHLESKTPSMISFQCDVPPGEK